MTLKRDDPARLAAHEAYRQRDPTNWKAGVLDDALRAFVTVREPCTCGLDKLEKAAGRDPRMGHGVDCPKVTKEQLRGRIRELEAWIRAHVANVVAGDAT